MTVSNERLDELVEAPFADTNPLLAVGHSVIISAHIADLDPTENAKRSADMLEDLLDLVGFDATVYPVQGRYQGVEEQSFVISLPEKDEWYTELYAKLQTGICDIARKYGQSSMMLMYLSPDESYQFAMFVDDTFDMSEHPMVALQKDCANVLTDIDYFIFKDVCYTTIASLQDAYVKAVFGMMLDDITSLDEE